MVTLDEINGPDALDDALEQYGPSVEELIRGKAQVRRKLLTRLRKKDVTNHDLVRLSAELRNIDDVFHDFRGDKKRSFDLVENIEEITIKYVGAKDES